MDSTPIEFEAIGTSWKIYIRDTLSNEAIEEKRKAILDRIEAFDKNYSRFRSDSLVTEMATEPGIYTLPDDAQPMLSMYEKLYTRTDGQFTPLIGQALSDAGYDAKYSFAEKELRSPPRWNDVLVYKFPYLTLKKPALLDFGGLGKGYLIDIVGEIIERHNINSYLIDAGGDMKQKDASDNHLRIGLEHPHDFSKVLGVAYLRNNCLSGSAGNRRVWGRFHHILNPHTLESPRHIASVWTTANTSLLADAMATCLFFVPPEKLKEFEFEYLIINKDLSWTMSDGFRGEIFTSSTV